MAVLALQKEAEGICRSDTNGFSWNKGGQKELGRNVGMGLGVRGKGGFGTPSL